MDLQLRAKRALVTGGSRRIGERDEQVSARRALLELDALVR